MKSALALNVNITMSQREDLGGSQQKMGEVDSHAINDNMEPPDQNAAKSLSRIVSKGRSYEFIIINERIIIKLYIKFENSVISVRYA
jgi:hypothetical protein